MLILNRDLRGSMVPKYDYTGISEVAERDHVLGPSSYVFALSELERFAATFYPQKYAQETGKELDLTSGMEMVRSHAQRGELADLDLSVLRWALVVLSEHSFQVAEQNDKAILVDQILDAIHVEVTGTRRASQGFGPYEPQIGVAAMQVAQGQLRFDLVTGLEFDRERIFDYVAGQLLRQYGREFSVRALGLYPPFYAQTEPRTVHHRFVMAIEESRARTSVGVGTEQDRFARDIKESFLRAGLNGLPED